MDKSKVISEICSSLNEDNKEKCVEIIREEYPFNYIKYEKRSYTKSKMKIYLNIKYSIKVMLI